MRNDLLRATAIATGLVLAGGAAFATDEAVVLMYHRFGAVSYTHLTLPTTPYV